MAYGSVLDATLDPPEARKARGAFFTPQALADFIVRWAIRDGRERVLEPACGEGEFVLSVCERISDLRAGEPLEGDQVVAYEIHPESARQVGARLRGAGYECRIVACDFLRESSEGGFDVAVGNPPYVRFQGIDEDQREDCRRLSRVSGVQISALSSLWVPFVIQSCLFLNKGGRLGLVLPSELLSVNYAASVRRYLLRSFARLQLVTFERRVFPEVQEEVVLLLAEGYREGGTDIIEWRQCADLDDIACASIVDYAPDQGQSRWSDVFASREALSAQAELVDSHAFVALSEWGKVSLGAVTGNNSFFALSERDIAAHGLEDDDCIDLCPPGSRHLRAVALTRDDFEGLRRRGAKTRLFYPQGDTLSPRSLAYIDAGEAQGIDKAYKCRVRSPWWRVPITDPPDAFVTYMNAFGPSICANKAGVPGLNSCHGLYLKSDYRSIDSRLLAISCLNSATMFGAEIVGRSYGGGMLKLEPREASRLPVPSPELVELLARDLVSIEPQVEACLRRGDLDGAISFVDAVFAMRVDAALEFEEMRASAHSMRMRRKNRSNREGASRV